MRSHWVLPGVVVWFTVFISFGLALPSAAQTPAAAPAWPHTLTVGGATVVVYQPQAIDWPNHETLTTREAMAITLPGDAAPVLGTTEISFSTQTDAATGQVFLSNPQLITSHFPTLNTDRAARIEARIRQVLPDRPLRPVPLQSVLLSLRQQTTPERPAVSNDPPAIFYSTKPASLVVFDGEPVLAPVGKTGLSYAVNTNWEIFTDGNNWYLLNNGLWLAAPAYSGPYRQVTRLPPAFSALPVDANFAAARKAIPPPPAVRAWCR